MRKRFPDREDSWTPEEAGRVLDEAEQSGESLAAFARRHGLGPARLYWWRKRLAANRSTTMATPTLSLVPAMIMPGPAVAVVIRLRGDVTIEIADAAPSAVAALGAELARSLP